MPFNIVFVRTIFSFSRLIESLVLWNALELWKKDVVGINLCNVQKLSTKTNSSRPSLHSRKQHTIYDIFTWHVMFHKDHVSRIDNQCFHDYSDAGAKIAHRLGGWLWAPFASTHLTNCKEEKDSTMHLVERLQSDLV